MVNVADLVGGESLIYQANWPDTDGQVVYLYVTESKLFVYQNNRKRCGVDVFFLKALSTVSYFNYYLPAEAPNRVGFRVQFTVDGQQHTLDLPALNANARIAEDLTVILSRRAG
ncbi:MAG: hypothetical protein IJL69_06310 [Oscillospiraceae bacterium]|nr:hypothetical protein [Oscillospiraceae bacterium]